MYGYTNDAGEPIMDGAAYRYEGYVDSIYEPDPYGADDDYYAEYDGPEDDFDDEDLDAGGMEDQWLDGSYEE